MTSNLFLSFSLSSLFLFPPFLPINHFDFSLTNSFPADGRQTATIPSALFFLHLSVFFARHFFIKEKMKEKSITDDINSKTLQCTFNCVLFIYQ